MVEHDRRATEGLESLFTARAAVIAVWCCGCDNECIYRRIYDDAKYFH